MADFDTISINGRALLISEEEGAKKAVGHITLNVKCEKEEVIAPTPDPIPTEETKPTPALETEKTPTTETTPAPEVDTDITKEIPYAENVPVEEKEVVIKKTNTDKKDIDGSVSKYLMPKATAKKQTIKLTWNKIKGADGYIIYGNLCGKKLERVTEIKSGSKKTWTAKKLKKGKYYKYVVVAYKTVKSGQKKVITTSKTVH